MSAIQAIYENGVFRPTGPVNLPERCTVELEFTVPEAPAPNTPNSEPSIEDKLARLAAQIPAAEWNHLPVDLSGQVDHYLYGTPRE
jgi:predicted DNA-binding antitoxin AbrB/MazE fold protein